MPYEKLGTFRSTLVFTFLLLGLWYLTWRSSTLAPDAPIFSWTLYLAEIYGFASALLHIFMTWRLTNRHAAPPTPGLSVDVFITTYNEPAELVRKTLLAAKHMDYSHETWLLDDGKRPEMEELAKRLEVHYISRDNNLHAKAGNLNNALKQTKGEFIAVFDADHAPQKNFLIKTLGYFTDPKVAFVQTPQDFFNLDSYQHRWNLKKKQLWTEQSLFFRVILRGKDYWNAAFFCGSCAVLRRKAIEQIGGFATQTVTEDLHTSIKLHKAGFRSVYHSESLAFGIAPLTISPFLHQRIRWGQGAMQVLKEENVFFTSRLTLAQRLNYSASILTYFDGWQKGIFYIAPAIVLIAGIMPIKAGGVDFLLHFLPYYLLSLWVFKEVGRGYGGILYNEQYNIARFAAFAWATLGLFVKKLPFKVTTKVLDKSAGSSRIFLPQMAVLIFNASAVPISIVLAHESVYIPKDAMAFNLFWAAVNILLAVSMLSHALRTQAFVRSEYRFTIPLPVLLSERKNTFIATIDNISSHGCRIYGNLPPSVKKDGEFAGAIYLSSGPLAFHAKVMSEIKGHTDSNNYIKALGCNFIWSNPENRDALELFLYGSDLQLRLMGIKEENSTPIQWLKRMFVGERFLGVDRDERWVSFSFMQEKNKSLGFGVIPLPSDGSPPKQIVAFAFLDAGTQIVASITTRTKQVKMQITIQKGAKLENSAGLTYLYSVSDCIILQEAPQIIVMESEQCESPIILSSTI